jgi:hypothetical protein
LHDFRAHILLFLKVKIMPAKTQCHDFQRCCIKAHRESVKCELLLFWPVRLFSHLLTTLASRGLLPTRMNTEKQETATKSLAINDQVCPLLPSKVSPSI